jgi:hypothetical protein
LDSVERRHVSTLDGHTAQAHPLCRRTVKDAVRIQPPEEGSLRSGLTTRPGGRHDRAGRPTSIYSTPGSSYW